MDEHGERDSFDDRIEALIAASTGPTNWRHIAAEDAAAEWARLREWVEWFRDEFVFDHRVVPPCWFMHRALVNVLSAIRDEWRASYDPLTTPEAAANWHRSLMQLESRLREWSSRTNCTLSAHRPDQRTEQPDLEHDWRRHVAGDVQAREQRAGDAARAGAPA